jgi:hypothetical protein
MIDYHDEVVSALETILPTYYEMALTSKTETPCISYMELNNYEVFEPSGNSTLGYSSLKYQVKVWSHRVGELQEFAVKIDKAMRSIGFKRVASGELYDNNSTMMQKILTYEALALEEF